VTKKSNDRRILWVHPDFKKRWEIMQGKFQAVGRGKISSPELSLRFLPELERMEKEILSVDIDSDFQIKVKMDKNRGLFR